MISKQMVAAWRRLDVHQDRGMAKPDSRLQAANLQKPAPKWDWLCRSHGNVIGNTNKRRSESPNPNLSP